MVAHSLSVTNPLIQDGFDRRFDWGLEGARRLAPVVDLLVVVDVLSFSTAVDVAVARGATVIPVAWRDSRAVDLAHEMDAYLAVGRSQVTPDYPYSLSPASLIHIPEGSRLVLPSPNGATICAEVAAVGVEVFTACLRNSAAVATACAGLAQSIGVIAAGEKWPEGSLRPAIEDLLGAGSVLAALGGTPSPEARAAIAVSQQPGDFLTESASARELAAIGHDADVAIASEQDVSLAAPRLRDGVFIPRGS